MEKELISIATAKGFILQGKLILPNENYLWLCELQKWLREVHKIHIDIQYLDEVYRFFYKITTMENNTESDNSKGFETYEKALEIGLYEAFKLIK